jgi:hypothetical protein
LIAKTAIEVSVRNSAWARRKHGSWLNLVEGFLAKAARSVLRHIRVGSKHEFKQRIIEFIHDLNHDPVIHRWHYKIDTAA